MLLLGLSSAPDPGPHVSGMSARAVRSRPRWGIWLFFLLLAGLFTLAALAGAFAYEYRYADRIYEGVQVAGIPLGNMSLEEATAAIKDGLTPYPGNPITLHYAQPGGAGGGERSWLLTLADLGVSVDAEKTAAAAFGVGRRGEQNGSVLAGLAADLASQWAAFQFGCRVTPVLRYDLDGVDRALQRLARDLDLPPREGTLTISGLEVTGTPGQPGHRMDIEATRAALLDLLREGKGGSLAIAMEERQPAVISVAAAVAKAKALLNKPLILVSDGIDGKERFAVDTVTLRNWLTFSPVRSETGEIELGVQLDGAQVAAFLQGLAEYLDQPPRDAVLDFDLEKGQVVVLGTSQAGQKLEVQAAAGAVAAALVGEGGSAAVPGPPATADPSMPRDPEAAVQSEIKLPITVVEPKVDSNRLAEMGIVEVVSKATTRFKGSNADRVHNIATGAEKFRGVVIPPGEEFSFNKNVGEISAANGFVEGLIIGAERTATGVGGGICQVSTTVFRAAFNGGFPITERHAHGYVVSWYGEPGLDATIFTPKVDFRFRNDTGHFLLVKPAVDTTKGEITFYLYGTRPDRVVESDPPQITNVRKPEPPIYEENADLAKGTIKQVDWAKDGMDAVVKRRIKTADGKVSEQKFASKYQPWRAIYQYGPGTELPAGAAGS
jgi:vancomycin resistance protein YoaR